MDELSEPSWAKALREEVRELTRRFERLSERPTRPETFIKAEYFVGDGGILMVNEGSKTIIHGSVGALAQDHATQVVGTINQNLTQLQDNPETRPAAEALKTLAEAIAASQELPSDRERKRYLEDIEELSTQAAKPAATREKGVVGPILDRLANLCSGAGGLAAVWTVAGPSLMALFT